MRNIKRRLKDSKSIILIHPLIFGVIDGILYSIGYYGPEYKTIEYILGGFLLTTLTVGIFLCVFFSLVFLFTDIEVYENEISNEWNNL